MVASRVNLASGASPKVKDLPQGVRVKWATADTINEEATGAEDVAEDGSSIWDSYYCDVALGSPSE